MDITHKCHGRPWEIKTCPGASVSGLLSQLPYRCGRDPLARTSIRAPDPSGLSGGGTLPSETFALIHTSLQAASNTSPSHFLCLSVIPLPGFHFCNFCTPLWWGPLEKKALSFYQKTGKRRANSSYPTASHTEANTPQLSSSDAEQLSFISYTK